MLTVKKRNIVNYTKITPVVIRQVTVLNWLFLAVAKCVYLCTEVWFGLWCTRRTFVCCVVLCRAVGIVACTGSAAVTCATTVALAVPTLLLESDAIALQMLWLKATGREAFALLDGASHPPV